MSVFVAYHKNVTLYKKGGPSVGPVWRNRGKTTFSLDWLFEAMYFWVMVPLTSDGVSPILYEWATRDLHLFICRLSFPTLCTDFYFPCQPASIHLIVNGTKTQVG